MKKLLLYIFLFAGIVKIADAQTVAASGAISYEPVKRNHSRPIIASNNDVMQDNVQIATYTVNEKDINGKPQRTFSIFLPGGYKVADAIVSERSCTVITVKDSKVYPIGLKDIDDSGMMREIATFLTDKRYL